MGRAAADQQLSFVGKLDILPAVVTIISAGLLSVLTGLWRSQKDAPSLLLHVAYAILRRATSRLSPLQLQFISPTTEARYNRWAKSQNITPQTVAIGHGAKGHWIGEPNAQKVMIWYHGGGFCVPANAGYFKFWANLVQVSRDAGKDFSIFAVSYTLAPNARYPTQLTQAVEALRYILNSTSRDPSQILLGGDSVGGNLAIGVLSHLAHPHPSIEALKVSEPLAGMAAIGPKTSMDDNFDDTSIYYGGDLITPGTSKMWSRTYLADAARDYYTDASDAPSTWFESFPVKEILIVAGQNEILLPKIEAFVKVLKSGFPSVEFLVGKQEAHVAPIYNMAVGDRVETEQGKRLISWLRDTL